MRNSSSSAHVWLVSKVESTQALRGKLLSTHVWIATLGGLAKEFILTLWKGTFPMVAQ